MVVNFGGINHPLQSHPCSLFHLVCVLLFSKYVSLISTTPIELCYYLFSNFHKQFVGGIQSQYGKLRYRRDPGDFGRAIL